MEEDDACLAGAFLAFSYDISSCVSWGSRSHASRDSQEAMPSPGTLRTEMQLPTSSPVSLSCVMW